jgi:hypothetical protein
MVCDYSYPDPEVKSVVVQTERPVVEISEPELIFPMCFMWFYCGRYLLMLTVTSVFE